MGVVDEELGVGEVPVDGEGIETGVGIEVVKFYAVEPVVFAPGDPGVDDPRKARAFFWCGGVEDELSWPIWVFDVFAVSGFEDEVGWGEEWLVWLEWVKVGYVHSQEVSPGWVWKALM